VVPPTTLPIKVWWQDESRFGLHTIARRRLTLTGIKPMGLRQHRFQALYLFGIVAPATGETYFETALKFNLASFQPFLDTFATHHSDSFNIIVLDNSKVHHAKDLCLPPQTVLLFLPPYAPELNPVERIWLALKSKLAWLCLSSLSELQDRLDLTLHAFSDSDFLSLSAFPFISSALYSL
jgi:transposase